MTDNMRPYDRQEWVKIANEWLGDKHADSSMLEVAYIALRIDEPELAEKCQIEYKRRRNLARSRKDR